MNVKEAEKILKMNLDGIEHNAVLFYRAKGYLEAIKKAKELERIVREYMSCICNPQNGTTCVRCDTLRKWEKRK